MTCIVKLKRIFENFLETRVSNHQKAKNKSKAIDKDKRKYNVFYNKIKVIQFLKKFINIRILLKIEKEKSFIDLHFLKMLEYYIYLSFYHENIQKLLYNQKLLNYFEKVINTKGFDPTKWDPDYNLQRVREVIIYFYHVYLKNSINN